MYKELNSLYSIYNEAPIFGVFYEHKQKVSPGLNLFLGLSNDFLVVKDTVKEDTFLASEFEEIDTKEAAINSKFTAYLADGSGVGKRRDVFYCKELGFAMEKLKDGYTIKDLWEVIPSTSNQYQ